MTDATTMTVSNDRELHKRYKRLLEIESVIVLSSIILFCLLATAAVFRFDKVILLLILSPLSWRTFLLIIGIASTFCVAGAMFDFVKSQKRAVIIEYGKALVPKVLSTLDAMKDGKQYIGHNVEIVQEKVTPCNETASVSLLCRTSKGNWFRLLSTVEMLDSSVSHLVIPVIDDDVRREFGSDAVLYEKYFEPPTIA
jgi:hypothetical protein